jgi:hypothetical protein
MLLEATGVEPVTLRVDGVARQGLTRFAGELSTALVALGRRGPGTDHAVIRSAPVPVLAVPVATRI